ncbi:MAG TPA: 16S rRNA (adenine(1518)-N(6)/adenine(1519)-N(6))-dimethyltransferase RsmA [Candidatus Limnocylindrales bacterium]|nr:16S rRNA (adenine(1518)-N(6)/adenine(1519)-N(6))-dimethyltransferase RsmA [Candidatus Limnocylindrales bacterium]
MTARARWGQNFLIDRSVAERIVAWADVEGRPVLEIGPGRGALTALLAQHAASLTLVEIDPALAGALREKFAGANGVRVVEGDVLRMNLPAVVAAGTRVVSNLPYESGTAIVASLLRARPLVEDMVVMLQKEVVERIAARPGSKSFGGLSVLVQMIADVRTGFVVAPRSFRPRPRVESQVVRIRPLSSPRVDVGDEETLREVVHASFGNRRKMLRNSLGAWLERRVGEQAAARVFADADVAPSVRPEDLPLEAFAALSRATFAAKAEAPRSEPHA